jgi:hypothetical protein
VDHPNLLVVGFYGYAKPTGVDSSYTK